MLSKRWQGLIMMSLAVTLTLAFASPAFAQRDTGIMVVRAMDPDGDILSYRWEIMREATDLGFGGDQESVPEQLGEALARRRRRSSSSGSCTRRTPSTSSPSATVTVRPRASFRPRSGAGG